MTAHPAVGRVRAAEGHVDAQKAAALAATLETAVPGDGAPLPPLWHWCGFWQAAPMASLGADGHARLGDFLPDLGLPRRMWAGGRVTWSGTLRVGERLRQRSEITSVVEKTSRAGPMALVTLSHVVEGAEGRVAEEQDLVYLTMPERFDPPPPRPVPDSPEVDETVETGPVLLFRYSALTFNGHRIHYDRTYCTDVAQYPGLVVHGPLQATLLAGLATRLRGTPPRGFRYRGVHPLFDTAPLRLLATSSEDGGLDLCTASLAGHQGLHANASWA